jgi:hypothetical protein
MRAKTLLLALRKLGVMRQTHGNLRLEQAANSRVFLL